MHIIKQLKSQTLAPFYSKNIMYIDIYTGRLSTLTIIIVLLVRNQLVYTTCKTIITFTPKSKGFTRIFLLKSHHLIDDIIIKCWIYEF